MKDLSAYPPKTLRENLLWRARVLALAETDETFRAAIKELFCRNVLFAFNGFFYTIDVRQRPRAEIPFITWSEPPYAFQDRVILDIAQSIERGEDLIIDKPRDVGVTWMALGVIFWFWVKGQTTNERFDALCGSRIEDYVDKKGDPRTIFEKIRFIREKLPWWLQPEGFIKNKHDHHMKLINPQTKGTITGESNNANFSTGGRYNVIFYDEYAKWKDTDVAAWTAGGDASPCRIPASTAFGSTTKFSKLLCDEQIKQCVIDYWEHPTKGDEAYCRWPKDKHDSDKRFVRSPWFDNEERSRRTQRELWQEVLRKHLGSGESSFMGKALARIEHLLETAQHRSMDVWQMGPSGLFEKSPDHTFSENSGRGHKNEFGIYLDVWRQPKPGDLYAVGVDVAEGNADGDYSVICGLNRKTQNVDWRVKGKIDEVVLASVVKGTDDWLSKLKAKGIFGIETKGPGYTTFDLCELVHEMKNLFYLPSLEDGSKKVYKGFKTTTVSRNWLFGKIREWLINELGWLNKSLANELINLETKGGKPQAKPGFHDDEVLAFGIALCVDEVSPISITHKPKEVDQTLVNFEKLMDEPVKKIPILTPYEMCMQVLAEKQAQLKKSQEFLNQLNVSKNQINLRRFL